MKEDICNILQCAGLIHDTGIRLGHFGEDVIQECKFRTEAATYEHHGKPMEQVMSRQMVEDLYHFEGKCKALAVDETAG